MDPTGKEGETMNDWRDVVPMEAWTPYWLPEALQTELDAERALSNHLADVLNRLSDVIDWRGYDQRVADALARWRKARR